MSSTACISVFRVSKRKKSLRTPWLQPRCPPPKVSRLLSFRTEWLITAFHVTLLCRSKRKKPKQHNPDNWSKELALDHPSAPLSRPSPTVQREEEPRWRGRQTSPHGLLPISGEDAGRSQRIVQRKRKESLPAPPSPCDQPNPPRWAVT